ncbi:hypothetical protein ACFQZZ_08060 [Nocardia sp. GCM10030253]|uniref:hypothetical protein n=1 Tax=Nocardia sp. GCM10030253 TaxID=3273404 RepID=UPI00362C2942
MAVAIELTFTGATLAQYDQVVAKMGLQPGGPGPSGALFHWVTKTDNGFRVTDVWKTAEMFQVFSDEKIGPITKEVGMDTPPEIRTYEVHNYLTAGD